MYYKVTNIDIVTDYSLLEGDFLVIKITGEKFVLKVDGHIRVSFGLCVKILIVKGKFGNYKHY